MCGIAGYFSLHISREKLKNHLELMTSAIARRGPDGQQTWYAQRLNLGFGHRRLAIIDLSDSAKQPMQSANNRYVITFNGEIYNYLELKKELRNLGVSFKTTSDSEVLLEAISSWGVKIALKKARGMFALSLFDRQEQMVYLARDRFGQKPLYYLCEESSFAFASELKSFKCMHEFKPEIDNRSLDSFFRFNHIGGANSIFKGIRKVENGTISAFKLSNQKVSHLFDEKFWDLSEVWKNRRHFNGSFSDARQNLHELLQVVINEQKRSDVPLGCFLSSGIDSTIISQILQRQSSGPIQTFSIGFPDEEFDESAGARFYAEQIGSEHHEFKFSDNDLLRVIPECIRAYDEPFADTSQLPTMLLCKHARSKVKVCLSGDGADEMFAGYYRHLLIPHLVNLRSVLPGKLLDLAGKTLKQIPHYKLNSLLKVFREILPGINLPRHLATKLHKLSWALSSDSSSEMHESLMNQWQEEQTPCGRYFAQPDFLLNHDASPLRESMLNDLNTYLKDDILVKVDRAAMHYGLETRMPYLDHRLLDFSFTLPDEFLVQQKRQKRILEDLQRQIFPQQYKQRGKTGFSPPLKRWLQGNLRSWAEESIHHEVMEKAGLDNAVIQRKWNEFIEGRYDWSFSIWSLVMFSNWYQKFHER